MAKFTVIKKIISRYAVEVEATDATQAVIKAANNLHDSGDLIDDEGFWFKEWEVYAGELNYPLPPDSEALRTDKARIIEALGDE